MKIFCLFVGALASVALLAQTPPPASFVTAKLFAAATAGPYGYGAAQPYGLAVGDFNKDGKPDIIAASWSSQVTVSLGNGDGTFQSMSRIYPLYLARAVAMGDFNRNGNLDAAVLAAGSPGSVDIYLGDGTGNLNGPTLCTVGNQGPVSITTSPPSNDGPLMRVALGNGDGTYRAGRNYGFVEGYGVDQIAAADLRLDGNVDIRRSRRPQPSVARPVGQRAWSAGRSQHDPSLRRALLGGCRRRERRQHTGRGGCPRQ
jgi:hypothetical protein